MKKLIIDEDTVYEIDEECLRQKTEMVWQPGEKREMREESPCVYRDIGKENR